MEKDHDKWVEFMMRFELGLEKPDINRIHSFNPFLIWQISHSSKFNELIYGIMYTFSY